MSGNKRVLIAGVGNIFFGDDAFGCELAQRLSRIPWATCITVRDFGIRGIDLAYALLEPYDYVILLDAVMRGGKPGTLYFIRPDIGTVEVGAAEIKTADTSVEPIGAPNEADPATPASPLDAHSLDPEKVLRLAASWGALPSDIVLIGCEPAPFDADEDVTDGLSAAVRAVLDVAEQMVRMLVDRYLSGDGCELSHFRKYMEAGYH